MKSRWARFSSRLGRTNSLIDEGLVDEDRVRLTVAARVADAKVLTKPIAEGGNGLSGRQAAKQLGISETQLRRDLRHNSAESAPKGRAEKVENVAEKNTKPAEPSADPL